METITTIVFSDINHKEFCAVYYDGKTLRGSNDMGVGMYEPYLEQGMTVEAWVERFSAWTNGYVFSEVVPQ